MYGQLTQPIYRSVNLVANRCEQKSAVYSQGDFPELCRRLLRVRSLLETAFARKRRWLLVVLALFLHVASCICNDLRHKSTSTRLQCPSIANSHCPFGVHHIATMSNEPQKSKASGSETYDGTCHCGTVQYSVTLSPPLAQQEVRSCNCTICTRNGYLFVYPEREQLEFKSATQDLGEYTFGRKKNVHKFCKRCGSSLYTDPRMKEFGEGPPDLDLDLLAVNVCPHSSGRGGRS